MSISTPRHASMVLDSEQIEDVSRFTYLGTRIDSDGDASSDVNVRIGKAAGVFRRLNKVWSRNIISLQTKIKLYMSLVVHTAIYACETWKSTAIIIHKLNVFHQRCLPKNNEDILERPYHE